MTGVKFAALFLLLLLPLAAQPLTVFSEFARIDATGKVTSPADPREILSPALARNAFSSFQIVVELTMLEAPPAFERWTHIRPTASA